jgi:hypothetical protein
MKLALSNDVKLKDSYNNTLELYPNSPSSSEVIIKIVKSSEVSEDEKIKLDDKIFQFDYKVEGDELILTLFELDVLPPFIYQVNITMEELIKKNKIFKACKDLDEVKGHIKKLLQNNMITLSQNKNEEDKITFNIKALRLSDVEEIVITGVRKMTEYKNPMLLELYKIQKQQDKYLKEIDAILEKEGNSKDLSKKLKNLIKARKNEN